MGESRPDAGLVVQAKALRTFKVVLFLLESGLSLEVWVWGRLQTAQTSTFEIALTVWTLTLHSTPYTPHPTPYTLHSTLYTPNPTP